MPELAELSKQILIDQTPEGLRIQLIDQEGRSMFDQGSAKPNDRARVMLRAVARVVDQLPNRLTIAGNTSASANGARAASDWPLSSARADAARQLLEGAGVDPDRIYQVWARPRPIRSIRTTPPCGKSPHRPGAAARSACLAAQSLN